MTAADLAYIEGALGPEIASVATELEHRPTRKGWTRLLRLFYEQHSDVMGSRVGQRLLLGICNRIAEPPRTVPTVAPSDVYVPAGKIGRLDLSHGCYTGYETFRLAAEEINRSGAASEVRALLASGVTVRDLLRQRYGCYLGPREYWHDPHFTPDQADKKDFLKILGKVPKRKGQVLPI